MRTALVTIAGGRTGHVRRQQIGVDAQEEAPGQRVVVAMDPGERDALRAACGPRATVVGGPPQEGEPALAAARNRGARAALDAGAELLIFLDADCIPGPGLVARYRAASLQAGAALLCGPVAYLPPAGPAGYPAEDLPALARAHPARPLPGERELLRDGDHTLFWSLSFAIDAGTWTRLGGFHEGYVGYGAEDTDFGQVARRAGVELCWVGGAWAFHQHHPVSHPPVEHLESIVRNAELFHRRWGWWPMRGWLDAFAERGLVRFDEGAGRWVSGGAISRT